MIRVSPGVGSSASIAPSRTIRTQAQDEAPTFEDALGCVPQSTVESGRAPGEGVRKDEVDQRAAAEEPAAVDAQEPAGASERAASTGAREEVSADGAREAGAGAEGETEQPGAQKRTETGSVRTNTGTGEVRAETQAPIVPVAHPRGAHGAQGVPIPGAPAPEQGESADRAPSAEHAQGETPAQSRPVGSGEAPPAEGDRRARRPDFERARVWTGNLGPLERHDRPMPRYAPAADPEAATEPGPVVSRAVAEGPVVRAQEPLVSADARSASTPDAEGARGTSIQSAQGAGSGHQPQGEGSGGQWQAPSGAGARQADRAGDAQRTIESAGARAEESAPPTAKNGVELLGALGAGRAPVAPKGAAVSAGNAPAPDRSAASAGLEGAVTRGFSAVMRQNGGSVVIRLSPESLGPLRISMTVESATVSVMLEAGTAKAHELLSSSLGSLRQSLESHGLRVDRMSVTLSGPHTAGPGSGTDGAMHQRGSEDSGFGDRDASDGRSRGHADQEYRDRRGGALAETASPFGSFSEMFESSGAPLRFVATA